MRKHKKLRATSHDIKLPIFRAAFELVITSDFKKTTTELNLVDPPLENIGDGWASTTFQRGWTLMLIRNEAPEIENTVVHEVIHFVNALFKRIGYVPRTDNDEVQAHVTGYIVKRVFTCIGKHRKQLKKWGT